MVYSFAAAAALVTRLIKPIMGFVHQLGVQASIYMDDGNIVGNSQKEGDEATQLVLECLQLAGWNIQWAKTTCNAVKSCKYLGFVMDLGNFKYQATDGKIRKTEIMLMDLLQAAERGELVDAKHSSSPRQCHSIAHFLWDNSTTHVQRITAQAGWDSAAIWLGLSANVRDGSSGRTSLVAF
jgi:hypothetical protein